MKLIVGQQLPKSNEWQDFLYNHLISDDLLEKATVSKDIYVTKRQFWYSKNSILPLSL